MKVRPSPLLTLPLSIGPFSVPIGSVVLSREGFASRGHLAVSGEASSHPRSGGAGRGMPLTPLQPTRQAPTTTHFLPTMPVVPGLRNPGHREIPPLEALPGRLGACDKGGRRLRQGQKIIWLKKARTLFLALGHHCLEDCPGVQGRLGSTGPPGGFLVTFTVGQRWWRVGRIPVTSPPHPDPTAGTIWGREPPGPGTKCVWVWDRS